ncbi:DUF5004 domain-containing protein [Gelidibacter salicanalis]|nr:DUF5004 domain-containing protein [Gelidibacter salicanalis]
MKKMNVLMKSLLVCTALFMMGCNTDDGISCPEPITGELTAEETDFTGSWVLTGMEANDELDITDDNKDNPSKDVFAQYSECQRDLVYEFLNSRSYAFKQGTISTDCENKQSVTGTWSLNAKVLTLVSSCATQNITIAFNEEEDKFTYFAVVNIREVNGLVRSTKITFTFSKIQA